MWRNWQTPRFQVPVGDHMGSSPFIRTTRTHPLWVLFLRGADEGKDEERIGSREPLSSGDALREVSACGVSEIPFIAVVANGTPKGVFFDVAPTFLRNLIVKIM